MQSLRPSLEEGVDFFQDWASARNYLSGSPIYLDLKLAVERYLGFQVSENGGPGVRVNLEVNAHPPTSVLLVLPLGMLSYPDAMLVWNLVSILAVFGSFWIIARQLAIPISSWSLFPLVTLLLLCVPFRSQVELGQLSAILLLLLTGSWAAQRSNRPGWAGIWLAIAAAIKLCPGFMILYFILRGQWKAVVSAVLSFAVLTGLTVSVLGLETYRSYWQDVIPRVEVFRSGWVNASLPGLWTKLSDPVPKEQTNPFVLLGPVQPLWHSPALAQLGTWLSCGIVAAVLARIVWRARSRMERDQAFALTVIAMLLVSPITWNHYFLMLLVPLAIAWVRLPSSNLVRTLFLLILLALWLEPVLLYNAVIPGGYLHGTASPIHTLCVLSFQCYALLALFILSAVIGRPETVTVPIHPVSESSNCSSYTETAKPSLSWETVYDETPCGY